jgi:hypothetical protein
MRKNTNTGATSLPRRRRSGDPMQAFDSLPAPLRHWLAHAARPWSPASCRKIWLEGRQRGESAEDLIARLQRAEAKTLAREEGAREEAREMRRRA